MTPRAQNVARLEQATFDVLVIGGGINGAVSAAALSAHGARVALIDQGDFAHATSQESSNLAWGGIKYLEGGELRLVRNLCLSRNRLIAAYPDSVREIRFLVTAERGFRYPRALLYLGAWGYWLIGNGFTRPPRLLSRREIEREEPVIDTQLAGGFEYSDAYLVDTDARFVFGFVRTALDRGATIANYVEAVHGHRDRGLWHTQVRDAIAGRSFTIKSKALINACGPHVETLNRVNGIVTYHRHVFSKGVHLIVDRIGNSDRVLTFFADDGRLFFVIPLGTKSCIGTTDTRVSELPAVVTAEDRRFILDNINKRLRLRAPLTEADIIAERCGVRPLAVGRDQLEARDAEWTALSRRHVIEVDRETNHVSIFGGKITDCLNIGEEIAHVASSLELPASAQPKQWYGEAPAELQKRCLQRARELQVDAALVRRWWRLYGVDALTLLEDVRGDAQMAQIVIADYARCELHHMARREMIVKLEDFLRRRTQITLTTRKDTLMRLPGLMEACRILFGEQAEERFDEYFQSNAVSDTRSASASSNSKIAKSSRM